MFHHISPLYLAYEASHLFKVRRLQTHPSIALWAGNNENEAALRGNWYGTDADFQRYKADYVKLYVNTVKTTTNELDSGRDFLVNIVERTLFRENLTAFFGHDEGFCK